MNKLYLITGPAGVGKSTISNILANKMKKGVLIEGDDIYHFVKGGYVSPWKEGNHLDLMWTNSLDIIKNFLKNDYDVVFNYIIYKDSLEQIIKHFNEFEIKFILLMVDEKTIIKRDKLRALDCQQGDRSIILLNKFKEQQCDKKYILDTSKLSIDETVNIIENEDRFLVNAKY